MPKRIAVTTLNASTIDILNTIRQNANYEYQSLVPEISSVHEIPKVGEVLYGYPSLANQFINALVNRIALVNVKAAVFNNAYAELKKGYLEFGETVEEVFVNIAKAREFSAEKAASRELKRTIPDVRSALHTMNWRVQYPVTIQDEDLRMAFTSANGVQDLIAKIINSVYTASEYDEYLLFKYAIVKAIAHGKMHVVPVDVSDIKNAAKAFKGASNMLTFMKTEYNMAGVHVSTPKEDQYIFLDAMFDAEYDVDVLSAAFNMDKAMYEGHHKIIDGFDTFDNDRFEDIRANSDMIEEVTSEELALLSNVVGVLVDKEWFQFYDNQNKFTETYVASGEYWNYFYNVWKTISTSPFSNAIVFVKSTATTTLPNSITLKVLSKDDSDTATVLTCSAEYAGATLAPNVFKFVQTEAAVTAGIAVHPYGAIIVPKKSTAVTYVPVVEIDGTLYQQSGGTPTALGAITNVGETITLSKVSS